MRLVARRMIPGSAGGDNNVSENRPIFLSESVKTSIEMIRMMEPPDGYYLAFSGGKDSIVLHRLAEMAGVKFQAHYHLTSCDPPPLIKYIRANYKSVIHDRPSETMWTLIPKRLMPPTRLARYCCEVLKEGFGEGRVILMGVRWAESPRRRKTWKTINYCKMKGTVKINPILFWTNDEIWEFIRAEGLPYCELYDQGFKRIGCVGCPMSYRRRWELEQFPKIKIAWLHAFGRMIEARKLLEKTDVDKYSNKWDTPENVLEWYLSR